MKTDIKKMKIFKTYGPLEIKVRKDTGELETEHFWTEHSHLSSQIGCYIFAVRASKGIKPWYVGKTARTFKDEVFTERNLAKFYYPVITATSKGTPVFLFAASEKGVGNIPS